MDIPKTSIFLTSSASPSSTTSYPPSTTSRSFHRLSHFPGPPIAAVSHLYEAYHDFLLGGHYTTRIRTMYTLYGPIVCINPDELHCSDPHFTDAIYPSLATCARDKW